MFQLKSLFISSLLLLSFCIVQAQTKLSGRVESAGSAVPFANIVVEGEQSGTYSDLDGKFNLYIAPNSEAVLNVTAIGYFRYKSMVDTLAGFPNQIVISLRQSDLQLNQVVVTGNMKQSYVSESPVKVEVLTSSFLSKSPTNNIVEAIQTVNGVQEQINCGVCGTNDIHINGMEGPYTLMLIDGMPIMSSLASVYGFNGIPTALVEQIEIIKGPSSTLYGTEAVGGVINIITKSPLDAPKFTVNSFLTSHGEWNLDLGSSLKLSDKIDVTFGLNTYYNQQRFDYNLDNFTDIPLNKRLTLYNKWVIQRRNFNPATIALRYYKEDRFGGVMNWQENDRGSDQVYGESIQTDRVEIIGTYQLPISKEKIRIDYSFTIHKQNSYYGANQYLADQSVLFANFIWDKKIGKHDLLTGLTIRNNQYSDNTFADSYENKWIPGIFIQDEWRFSKQSSLLSGIRFDYHTDHGVIVSPRVNFKQKLGT
jgi:outer membrane receptor for ferrienterochelin and colicins